MTEPVRASVIGSGPNGLAAAIVLAQAGMEVDVFEAEAVPGGAARTLPLTLPGFRHDFGSAVHPMGAGSPFFRSLPLAAHGLEWIQPDAPLAHPLNDGSAVLLERDLDEAAAALGRDGRAWNGMMRPLVENWADFAGDTLGPLLRAPRHPFLLARFGMRAVQPARFLAKHTFTEERTRALFAGIAAHSFMSLDAPLSAAVGIMLGAAAHAAGWPVPRGGAQSITDALLSLLTSLGGRVHTSTRVGSLDELPKDSLVMCDVSPRALLAIAGERLRGAYRAALGDFKYGPGSFKVDYALSAPAPWRARECLRSATVHLGGSMAEIAASEEAAVRGQVSDAPFVLVAQPTLFDATRAPEGRHILWAYCHVPNGSTVDMTEAIERQIERFAPGFRECILAKHVSSPSTLEAMDVNLVGGDISGGAMNLRQMVLRPTASGYATPDPRLYLCSSSTPPGAGVHGMCGYHAAKLALKRLGRG